VKRNRISSKVNLILFGAVIALVAIMVWQSIPVEREPALNRTFERTSDLFFDYEITRYPSNVEITSTEGQNITIGIVTDLWNLNFGIIPNGGSYGTRHVSVSNMDDKAVKVSLNAFGSIEPLISFGGNDVMLKPGDSASFNIYLNTTNSTIPGNYTGEIDINVEKPKFNFLYSFL
jgi:hypothetical protein